MVDPVQGTDQRIAIVIEDDTETDAKGNFEIILKLMIKNLESKKQRQNTSSKYFC